MGGGRRRRQLAVVAMLFFFAAATAVVCLAFALPPAEQTCRLPDGTELTLLGVTYGRASFDLVKEGGDAARVLRLLPGGLLRRLGLSLATLENEDEQALVFWLKGPSGLEIHAPRSCWVRDEHGCDLPVDDLLGPSKAGENGLFGLRAGAAPRRARKLWLCFGEYRLPELKRALLAEFSTTNPATTASPVTAESLPIVRHGEDVDVTLTEFVTGLAFEERMQPRAAAPGERAGAMIRVEFASLGKKSQDWEVQSFDFIDPAGRVFGAHREKETGGSESWIELTPCFEEAWRVRCGVVPIGTKMVRPDEIWDAGELQLPKAGAVALSLSNTMQGAKVEVTGFEVTAFLQPGSKKLTFKAAVIGALPPPAPSLNVEVTLDGARRDRDFSSEETMWSESRTTYELAFEVPEDARTARLTLLLPRVRVFEFLAKPRRALVE